jgi:ComEC/Rec2-related protein
VKQPFVIVVLFYLAGIVAGDFLESRGFAQAPAPLIGLILFVSLAALFWSRGRRVLLPAALLLAGTTNQTLSTVAISPVDLRVLMPAESSSALATVRGRLLETPVERLYTQHDEVTHRTQAELSVEAVRWRNGEWQRAAGRVVISSAGVVALPFFRDTQVEIEGVLRVPPGPGAPGGFDYAAYLRRHGVFYQLQCAANDWRLRNATAAVEVPLADRFARWAKARLAHGLPEEDRPLQLLWAMTLGWRTALTGEVSEPFMRSGTMHVFAISGLHIALLAGLLVEILRVCRVPRAWCAVIVIPLLWLYTGATGWQASAIRSTIMMSVIVGGWLLIRPSNLLNSLAAAAFIILLWDPQQLFQAGFQLSFAVVLSLALLGPPLEDLRHRLFRYDPWVPDELRPRWQHWLRRPLDYLTTSCAVSLAAWLGSVPLVAAYFNLFTPVSLLANLVVVPLSSGALACALGSLLVGPFVPLGGELFNHSAWFLMLLMTRASEWSAALPGGCLHVGTPSFLFFLVYYATLAGLLAGWFQVPRWRWLFRGAVAALALIALSQFLHERAQTRLTVVPLNGGAAIHLASPERGQNWLIDCGDESSAGFVLKPYLRAQGINRLENLLLTHGDVHRVGGVALLRAAFPIEHAWLSPVPFRSTAYRAAQRALAEPPGLARIIHRGQTIAPWIVLHPDETDRLPQADDNAMVLYGQFDGARVLLLSDLGKPGQNLLVSRHPELKADLVISGLPAQSEPLADPLIASLQPRQIIVADAPAGSPRRANRRLRERLATHGIPVLYTGESGAVTITLRAGTWTVETSRPKSN